VELAHNSKIEIFRSDNGGEFISVVFTELLREAGIRRELTQPYTPHQNGVSERKNRTLLEKARAMVFEAKTPRYLWSEAVSTANYLTNRSPTRANSGISPYQHLHKQPPELHHLRVFGCLAFAHIPKEQRTKLDEHSRKCIMVGYSDSTNGYRLYNPAKRAIITSNDVKFAENRYWHTPIATENSPRVSLEVLPDSRVVCGPGRLPGPPACLPDTPDRPSRPPDKGQMGID
jgi:hypothetical protein